MKYIQVLAIQSPYLGICTTRTGGSLLWSKYMSTEVVLPVLHRIIIHSAATFAKYRSKHCGGIYRHPVHLILNDIETNKLQCMPCGQRLENG